MRLTLILTLTLSQGLRAHAIDELHGLQRVVASVDVHGVKSQVCNAIEGRRSPLEGRLPLTAHERLGVPRR